MRILDFLSAGTVKVPVGCRSKEEIIEELAGLLAAEAKVPDKQAFVAAVLKREQSMSTAVGEGIAIPHAKLDGIPSPCVAVGICPLGVQCESPDAKPVHVVLLIASSMKDAGAQLKILAALARYIKTPGFVAHLESAPTPQAVLDVFKNFEEVVRL